MDGFDLAFIALVIGYGAIGLAAYAVCWPRRKDS